MTIRNNEINQNANEIINRCFVSEGEGKKNVLEYQIATEKKIFFLLRNVKYLLHLCTIVPQYWIEP